MIAIRRKSIADCWLPLLLAGLGVAERIAWNLLRPTTGASGEAEHVAIAIGTGRGFADAYQSGQGPTAHLLPINPGIGGLVYRVFGVQTVVSEAVLAAWSIGLAIGTYLVLFRLFGRLGTARWARVAALAFGCLVPTYIGQEAVDFRVWEGGLAAFLAACMLDRIIRQSSAASIATPALLANALLCAFLFFVNPLAGAAIYGCAAIFCLTRLSIRQTLTAAAASAVILSLFIGAWAARNERALGQPVLLRSNAGLELALSQYPGALSPIDRKAAFLARLAAIHPTNLDAYKRMQSAGGEIKYSRMLGDQAKSWMAAHPTIVAQLILLHIRQTLVPQRWQFDVFGTSLSPTLRSVAAGLIGVMGLMGVAAALTVRRRGWIYPALFLAVLAALASLFQPVPRYTYLLYPTMLFCAFDLLARFLRGTARNSTSSRDETAASS